jgi:hypothetical protein
MVNPPTHWEYFHNHTILTLRLYYKGCNIDPDFPPPQSTQHIIVPVNRPPTVDPQRTFTSSRKPPPAQAKAVSGAKIVVQNVSGVTQSSLLDQYNVFYRTDKGRMPAVANESDLAMPSRQKRDFDNESSSSSSSKKEEDGTDSPMPKKRRAL